MKRLPFIHAFLLASLLTLSACGGGGSSDTADSGSSDAPAAAAVDSTPLGTASVSGSISFEGTAPEMPNVRMGRECAELNTEAHKAENVIVSADGGLQNVFIRVSAGLPEGYSYAPPSEAVILDQQGCMYTPHVFGVQVGQDLKILNSDPLLHNLNALAEQNRPFNFGMPRQGDERIRSFRVSEVMMKIKCDVHGWMSTYAGVVDHPYFSVSNESGSFSIGDLPAGTYTIEAWHEQYGSATQTITVGDGEAAELSFTFGA